MDAEREELNSEDELPEFSRPRKYDQSHAEMIYRARQYFQQERDNGKPVALCKVAERTSLATGASIRTVRKLKTIKDVNNWPYAAGKHVSMTRSNIVPSEFSSLVRKVIRDTFLEKKHQPTIDNIYERIVDVQVKDVVHLNLFPGSQLPSLNSQVWIWSRSTLYRYMKSIGFVYDQRDTHYEHTRRRDDVIKMRDDYLEWIELYRGSGYRIYYQDETWVFKNMTCSKVWKDIVEDSTQDAFMVPSGRGDRSILCHMGCPETGLLEECGLLFRGSKSNKSADYHSEMNWDVFSHWCEYKVFPKLASAGDKAVVLLDRATYHTVLDDEDRKPVTSWNKNRLVSAIRRWRGAPDDWHLTWASRKTKHQLLDYARKIYPCPKHKIQKIADKFDREGFSIKILFLPVAHPELNPIEMVWAYIKRSVASQNFLFSLSEVERLTREAMSLVTSTQFAKYNSHAMKEEERYKSMSLDSVVRVY